MSLAFSPDNQQFIEQALSAGTFPSEQALLDEAVAQLREREETLAAVREGLAQAERGEGMTVEEADARFRKKYGIPRRERA
ncbi:MAG: hypothetical protein RH917_07830 [Lacipirellulaceae bacterium]